MSAPLAPRSPALPFLLGELVALAMLEVLPRLVVRVVTRQRRALL